MNLDKVMSGVGTGLNRVIFPLMMANRSRGKNTIIFELSIYIHGDTKKGSWVCVADIRTTRVYRRRTNVLPRSCQRDDDVAAKKTFEVCLKTGHVFEKSSLIADIRCRGNVGIIDVYFRQNRFLNTISRR